MFSRLFALPCYLLIALLTLLPVMPAQAVGLPGMLGGSSKTQPQAEVPLGQSLDDVIKTGTPLDCSVSSELLKNLFWNKAPTTTARSSCGRGVLWGRAVCSPCPAM